MPASDALPSVAAELAGAPARAGRSVSFDALYDEHVDLVWRALRRFGVSPDALEDATQEVFLVAFRKLESFEGRCALSTWLYGIAAHTARNARRSQRRHPETPTEDAGHEEAAPAASPEDAASEREAARLLQELLDALDEDKREAFVLAELEGLSAPEIAASLGLNVNTVYARIRAGRAAFDQALHRLRARAAAAGSLPDKRAISWR